MHRAIVLFTAIILLAMMGCMEQGAREAINISGETGKVVRLSIQERDLEYGSRIEWNFTDSPIEPPLTQSDFKPIYTAPRVQFTPPVPGEYYVNYSVKNSSGAVVGKQRYVVEVKGAPPTPADQKMTARQSDQETEESSEEVGEHVTGEETPSTPPSPTAQRQRDEFGPATESGRTQQSTPGQATSDEMTGNYTVQVSSHKNRNSALSVHENLEDAGYIAFIQEALIRGEKWYRVRVGNFSTRSEAEAQAKALENDPNISGQGFWVDQISPEQAR